MKLNKNTQIILGVGALAVVGYFVWKNNNKKNADGKYQEDEGVRSNRVTLNPYNYPKNPKKANASGNNCGGGNFANSFVWGENCMPPQKDWVLIGTFRNFPLYTDKGNNFYWYEKGQRYKNPKDKMLSVYCEWYYMNCDPRKLVK